MKFNVTIHAVRRFEQRFPDQAHGLNYAECARLLQAAVNSGTLLRKERGRKGASYYLVSLAGETGVGVIREGCLTTVLTDDEFIDASRPTREENTLRNWFARA